MISTKTAASSSSVSAGMTAVSSFVLRLLFLLVAVDAKGGGRGGGGGGSSSSSSGHGDGSDGGILDMSPKYIALWGGLAALSLAGYGWRYRRFCCNRFNSLKNNAKEEIKEICGSPSSTIVGPISGKYKGGYTAQGQTHDREVNLTFQRTLNEPDLANSWTITGDGNSQEGPLHISEGYVAPDGQMYWVENVINVPDLQVLVKGTFGSDGLFRNGTWVASNSMQGEVNNMRLVEDNHGIANEDVHKNTSATPASSDVETGSGTDSEKPFGATFGPSSSGISASAY